MRTQHDELPRDGEGEENDCRRVTWTEEREDYKGGEGQQEGKATSEEGRVEGGGEGAFWGGGECAVEEGAFVVVVLVGTGGGDGVVVVGEEWGS